MVHGAEGFGDVVQRNVLVNPYTKAVSWNAFASKGTDLISVYFKSTRQDVDIAVLVMRCNGAECEEGDKIVTVPSNKALFQVFSAMALNGQVYGEMRILYAPESGIVLSDRDIVASFSNSYEQGGNVKRRTYLRGESAHNFTSLMLILWKGEGAETRRVSALKKDLKSLSNNLGGFRRVMTRIVRLSILLLNRVLFILFISLDKIIFIRFLH